MVHDARSQPQAISLHPTPQSPRKIPHRVCDFFMGWAGLVGFGFGGVECAPIVQRWTGELSLRKELLVCIGFRVEGLGFRVQGLGFRVQGLGCSCFHGCENTQAVQQHLFT